MSFEKLVCLIFYTPDDLVPLLCPPMRLEISFVLNLAADSGMFQPFFDCMFSDLKREYSVREIFVSSFLMDCFQLFLKSFENLFQRGQLSLLSLFNLSHFANSSFGFVVRLFY